MRRWWFWAAGGVLLVVGVAMGFWLFGPGSVDSRATQVGTAMSIAGVLLTVVGFFVSENGEPATERSQVTGLGSMTLGDVGSQVHSQEDARAFNVALPSQPAGEPTGAGPAKGLVDSQATGDSSTTFGDVGSQVHHGPDNRQFTLKLDERSVVPPKASVVVGAIPPRPATWVERPEQTDLERALDAGGRAVVCAGQRGVGKSVLAAAHAQERVDAGDRLVAWVSGATVESLIEAYRVIGARVGEADPEDDPVLTAERVLGYLNGLSSRSLLVVDNAEAPGALAPWLPTTGRCRVIITSNDHGFEELGRPVEIGTFDRPQSVTFLTRATGSEDRAGAAGVAEAFGDLPLALSQAAAVIRAKHWTYQTYLARLDTKPLSSLLPRGATGYPRGLADAVGLSIAAAASMAPGVKWLLRVVATVDSAGVNRDLLAVLCPIRYQGSAFDEALLASERLSLVGASVAASGSQTVVMHRLTARVVRDQSGSRSRLQGAHFRLLFRMAIALRSLTVESTTFEGLAEIARHADAVLGRLLALGQPNWRLGRAIRIGELMASDFVKRFRASELAVALLQRIADYHSSVPPLSQRRVLANRDYLASGYRKQGRYAEAILLEEETLRLREKVLRPQHPDILTSRGNLAVSYRLGGRYGEAVALSEETLRLRQKVLRPEHPNTITNLGNLGNDYRRAGRYAEATALDEQTVALCEKKFGPEDRRTLEARSRLANDYRAVGRHAEAIALDEQILKLREEVLGAEHPDTLTSRGNLAADYRAVHRYDEAITLDEQTLRLREKVLGAEHPDTLTSRRNLAASRQSYVDSRRATGRRGSKRRRSR